MQLPPLSRPPAPKRRLSSWTDNLEVDVAAVASAHDATSPTSSAAPNELKSPPLTETVQSPKLPKSPDGRKKKSFFGSKSIDIEPSSEERSEREGEKKEKKQPHKRRQSITDHLQRFKQKAEKVLEEVHDRLTDDKVEPAPATAADTSDIKSPPASLLAPSEASDSRPASPSLSLTSKRTSNSAELKDKLRSKIRKQAQKVVERTRGSVQLTQRLARSRTLERPETVDERDVDGEDDMIERGIQLGERFICNQPPSRVPPPEVQHQFFVGRPPSPERNAVERVTAYVPAGPAPQPASTLFAVHQARIADVDVESATAMVAQCASVDMRLAASRFGEGAVRAGDIGGRQTRACVKPLPLDSEGLLVYHPAARLPSGTPHSFVQLDINIAAVEFEHHWLCSEEESEALKLRKLFDLQITCGERLGKLCERMERRDDFGSSTPDEVIDEMRRKQTDFARLGTLIGIHWERLKLVRHTQGYSTTTLNVVSESAEEEESSEPESDQPSSIRALVFDHPLTRVEDLPKEERQRLDAQAKCSIHVLIHFNDTLVYKTKARPVKDFIARFAQIYNLEIFSAPTSITLTLVERFGSLPPRTMATVGVPLPEEDSFSDSGLPLHPVHFACDQHFDALSGSLGAGGPAPFLEGSVHCLATWSRKGMMKARWDERRKSRLALPSSSSSSPSSFSLIHPLCRLVSDEQFASDIRLDVLALRWNRRLAGRQEFKRIGVDSSEVDASLLFSDDRRVGDTAFRSGIDGMRSAGRQHAIAIRTQLLERFDRAERAKTYEDVVREEPMPTLFAAFGGLFGPADQSRKLKPQRKSVSRQPAPSAAATACSLIVNIQSAINLPVREERTQPGENAALHLQPFVHCAFRSEHARTSSVAGRNPNWHSTLTLPLSLEQHEELRSVCDYLEIGIYDRLVAPLPADDREHNTVHEQLLHRHIGRVRIPFSTIFTRGKIDGALRVALPLFATGYKSSEKPAYLKVLIALDPPLAPPRLLPPLFNGSVESERTLAACAAWARHCSSMHPDRVYTALVSDPNGKKVLACRYLRPLRPPPSVLAVSASPLRAARLAAALCAHIPTVDDPVMFPGMCDVWTTVDQFVSLGCGDAEEHAVLLCGWLRAIRIPAVLILGSALPEGDRAAYVLASVEDRDVLFNASDGHSYSTDDSMCPLLAVGCAVTPNNVYANVQSYAHSSHVHYDFKKASDWRPLFPTDRDDLASIQPESIMYADPSEDHMVDLRSTIEREVKVRFDERRESGIPIWNMFGSRCLREILQDYDTVEQPNITERLGRLREGFRVSAVAFRFGYSSIGDCVEHALSARFHEEQDERAQFAVAVSLSPQVGHSVAVLLAIAVMLPKGINTLHSIF